METSCQTQNRALLAHCVCSAASPCERGRSYVSSS